jgi:hypothetical protein
MSKTIDDVVRAYAETALWSSTHYAEAEGDMESGDGEPMDANHGVDDIHADTYAEMLLDVSDFILANLEDFAGYVSRMSSRVSFQDALEAFGHDFWLTRNGHGAGFWDRGLGALGDRLTDASKPYGEVNLWVDADGSVRA